MFTNTFAPHVGGVRRSIDVLTTGLKALGHKVLIVAPSFEGFEDDTAEVIRVPALQHVHGTDFSLPIPFSRQIGGLIKAFDPDIVHSHHPFLLGSTALRIAAIHNAPIVYTCHTRYERYAHYILPTSEALSRALQSLSIGYCNLCNAVIAPSESIASILRDDGVRVPIKVIPTGLGADAFQGGNGRLWRRKLGVPQDAFLVGHVGRMAEEKNLNYLADTLIDFLLRTDIAHTVIVGGGAQRADIEQRFDAAGLSERVHFPGVVTGRNLTNLYAAMDVFAFSSLSETQGLVLLEAMAAGCPAVALDGPGVREVIEDRVNGRLLPTSAAPLAFSQALSELAEQTDAATVLMHAKAKSTAKTFTAERMIDDVLALYSSLCTRQFQANSQDGSEWYQALRGVAKEQSVLSNIVHALGDAMTVEEGRDAG